jgi:hypothetical protein
MMFPNYKYLIKIIIKDNLHNPNINQLLDEIHGMAYFTMLDLKSIYNPIRLRGKEISKTTFRTNEGHYEFLAIPFGLTNVPSTFQSLLNNFFYLILESLVFLFHDIFIYRKS